MRYSDMLISGLGLLLSVAALAAEAVGAVEVREPEVTAAISQREVVTGQQLMAVTANPYATQAAYSILLQDGSAVDAMIAAQLVLNLVEPQSSGIGGGGFALRFDAKRGDVTAWDGRETAPAAATPQRFLKPDGTAMRWHQALVGGRSVGVPGLVALMAEMHQAHGKLPWRSLFAPAIRLAEQGFVVSPRLAYLLSREINPGMQQFTATADYFYPNGKPLQAGRVLKNPAFAATLKQIAKSGAEGFYAGWVADAMVSEVTGAKVNPGDLKVEDLQHYRVKQRKALCGEFVGYQVCGMPLPSSGGMTVQQILSMWASRGESGLSELQPQAVHLFTQLSRLAYADRNHYLGDSDFVSVPVHALLHPAYLQRRAQSVSMQQDMQTAQPGRFEIAAGAKNDSPEFPSTTHMTLLDSEGNAISMTSSIEMGFGSGLMAAGFLLNNQLTDFSLTPEQQGRKAANRVEAGKRPLSSMSPTIVLDSESQLHMAIGSPGGSRIINYVAQVLINTLSEHQPLQAALAQPHITNRNDYTALEAGSAAEALAPQLRQWGHNIRLIDLNSGLHGFIRCGEQWCGAADPRREGRAMGF